MSKQTTNQQTDAVREKIAEQAFAWLLKLEDAETSNADHAAFADWLKQSPVHVDEYLMVAATWRELDGLDPTGTIRIEDLLADTTQNVVPLQTATKASSITNDTQPAYYQKSRVALVASMTIVVIALLASSFLYQYIMPATKTYVTELGEQKSFTLDDGSVIHMNTQSLLRVRLSKQVRAVDLIKGEALFQVAGDPMRPFRVTASQTVVEALGTRFNVYRHDEQTMVTVVEGKIAVTTVSKPPDDQSILNTRTEPNTVQSRISNIDSVTLVTGEQVAVDPSGYVTKLETPDMEQVVAWQQRRLIFRDDALMIVANEFNRYNKLQIVIDGQTAAARKLSGVFDADDPTSLIEFLETNSSIRISRQVNRIIITDR